MATKRTWYVIAGLGGALLLAMVLVWWSYPRLVNLVIPAQHRPGPIAFPAKRVSDQQFEEIARQLEDQFGPSASAQPEPHNERVYADVVKLLVRE